MQHGHIGRFRVVIDDRADPLVRFHSCEVRFREGLVVRILVAFGGGKAVANFSFAVRSSALINMSNNVDLPLLQM